MRKKRQKGYNSIKRPIRWKGNKMNMTKNLKSLISIIVVISILLTTVLSTSYAGEVSYNISGNNSIFESLETVEGINIINKKNMNISIENVKEIYEHSLIDAEVLSSENVNGTVLTIIKKKDGTVTVINENTKEMTSYVYDSMSETLTIEAYLKGESGSFQMQTAVIVADAQNDFGNSQIIPYSITYGSKVKETYKNKYWYQMGSEGSKDYLKIGCVATYRLRTDNMSTARYDSCKDYKSSVKSCRDNMTRYNSAVKEFGWAADAVAAVIVANILFPITTIATILIGIFGSATASAVSKMVGYYVEAKSSYEDAVDLYATIKVWGTKL